MVTHCRQLFRVLVFFQVIFQLVRVRCIASQPQTVSGCRKHRSQWSDRVHADLLRKLGSEGLKIFCRQSQSAREWVEGRCSKRFDYSDDSEQRATATASSPGRSMAFSSADQTTGRPGN